MKKICLTTLISLLLSICLAGEGQNTRWQLLTEVDFLPYITGGYYLSAGAAKNHIRLRAVHSVVNIPDFATMEGFDNYQNSAVAVIMDYFPGRQGSHRGLWIGSGMEFWHNSLRNEADHQTKSFDQYIYTLGTGYVIPIGSHFIINPWGAGHLALQGKTTQHVGNSSAEIPAVMAEGSLKIGWRF
jgi:hypothetical protein